MRHDRRRSQRVSVQQALSITLGNGGGTLTAISDNLSLGGALFYCDRFIAPGSDLGLVVLMPPEITHAKAAPMWCSGKVLRVEQELKDGKFGIAVGFATIEVLPTA